MSSRRRAGSSAGAWRDSVDQLTLSLWLATLVQPSSRPDYLTEKSGQCYMGSGKGWGQTPPFPEKPTWPARDPPSVAGYQHRLTVPQTPCVSCFFRPLLTCAFLQEAFPHCPPSSVLTVPHPPWPCTRACLTAEGSLPSSPTLSP